MTIYIIYFGFILFVLIAHWIMLEKAGQPGIALIIPIYGTIVFLRMADYSGWYILLMLIPFVNIFIGILMWLRIATGFDKGVGFGIGLLFLPFIFVPILAFSDADYSVKRIEMETV